MKKTPKRGRPPKPKREKRERMIRVLTTVEEAKLLQEVASAEGLGVSSWIRSVALAAARKAKAA